MNDSTLKIKEALAEQGIQAVEVENVKNGVTCTGFQICTGTNIAPVVYCAQEETVEAFVEKVIRLKDQSLPSISPEQLTSRESLLRDAYVCVQRRSGEELVKRDFLNLEEYVRLKVELSDGETVGSVKITPNILKLSGVTEEELFEAARDNSLKKATVVTMAESLGLPEEMDITGGSPFFVATYEDKCHGAGIIALEEVFHGFCESRGYERINIIPSSTEEVLLLPMEDASPVMLAEMVAEINHTVDPVLRLDPVAYVYDDEIREVSIAASAYVEGV